MKKDILECAERILAAALSSFACIGMFLVIYFLLNLFWDGGLDAVVMVSVFLGSLFLTYCLTQLLMVVRYERLEILADELEQQKDQQAEELYEHLRVK